MPPARKRGRDGQEATQQAQPRRSGRHASPFHAEVVGGSFPPDEVAADEESEGEANEGEQRVESLVRAMTMRGAGFTARRVLVKWRSLPHEESTWEPRKHLHPELLKDFEWKRQLPFSLSELLELPPHAPIGLLEQERLLPVPTEDLSDSESESEAEDDDDDEGGDGEPVGESNGEHDGAAAAGEAAAVAAEDAGEEEWLTEGHELVGQRVLHVYVGKVVGEETVHLGTITKWVPANVEEVQGKGALIEHWPKVDAPHHPTLTTT